jgi:hypothetical protein
MKLTSSTLTKAIRTIVAASSEIDLVNKLSVLNRALNYNRYISPLVQRNS